ncbi:tyrosine-type recombinase/integrase [candidate division CSSED10-310 bacterium]|uniref:Tyrosine-type recombinase/integrase n=1 Tax=candidate division CSSED10-310 bacterium TaxID=2855610 RepID=A0ABV6Z2J0_UNCC1
MKPGRDFPSLIAAFINDRAMKNYSQETGRVDLSTLHLFRRWCETEKVSHPDQATSDHLIRYGEYLSSYRKQDGTPLNPGTRAYRLLKVVVFFRWMYKKNYILSDPSRNITQRTPQRSLPGPILTSDEVEQILSKPDLTTPLGIRNRTIIETLYSTGIRSSELIGLQVTDLKPSLTLFIRCGKGKKDRLVPIGERAYRWLQRYLLDVRPVLLRLPDDSSLFISLYGRSLSVSRLREIVRGYIRQSKIDKPGCCHLFRHTMATAMLENGADIRIIQEILGHASLKTTAHYTRVAITDLKSVHTRTHPFERT